MLSNSLRLDCKQAYTCRPDINLHFTSIFEHMSIFQNNVNLKQTNGNIFLNFEALSYVKMFIFLHGP